MLFREQSKLLSLGARDDLGTIDFGLQPQATVLKSSPAPRVNSIDCSLNRHEITVYYQTNRENSSHNVDIWYHVHLHPRLSCYI